MTGSRICEGYVALWWTVFCAVDHRRCVQSGSPVLGLTSNRGKLELDTSSRIRCPAANRLLVG